MELLPYRAGCHLRNVQGRQQVSDVWFLLYFSPSRVELRAIKGTNKKRERERDKKREDERNKVGEFCCSLISVSTLGSQVGFLGATKTSLVERSTQDEVELKRVARATTRTGHVCKLYGGDELGVGKLMPGGDV